MTDVYQNFQMERRPQNLKSNLKGNSDAQKTSQTSTQRLQAPPVSSRILYGLVALCAGLLLAVTTLCVFITYQQVRQNDPNLESALTNLSVSVNAQAKHLSQEVAQALEKLDTMKGMVERMKQDYSTEALQKDMKKSLSALERLSDCARKETSNPVCSLCEEAWSRFQLNCYKLYGEKKTWKAAKQHCEAQKAHLIVINSDAEQDLMKDMAKGQYVWLGLTDADGSWKWVDGTPYDCVKRFWSDGQPDDWTDPKYREKEDCASSVESGKWNDAHCSEQLLFLCEKEL